MTKEEYIIEEMKRRFPESVKEIEFSYIKEYERKINSDRLFKEFCEKLDKL